MGMSASQARLLTLTARLSDLEFQAQQLSNAKIRLSQRTEEAATNYNNALTKQTLEVWAGVDTETQDERYVQATAYNLTTYGAVSELDKQRFLRSSTGQILVSETIASAYDANENDLTGFLAAVGCSAEDIQHVENKIALAELKETTDKLKTIPAYVSSDPIADQCTGEAAKNRLETIKADLEVLKDNAESKNDTATATKLQTLINMISNVQGYVTSKGAGETGNVSFLDQEILKLITTGEMGPLLTANSTVNGQDLSQFQDNNIEYYINKATENSSDTGALPDFQVNGRAAYYTNVFNMIQKSGYISQSADNMNNSDWLYAQLKSGNLVLVEQSTTDDLDGDGEKDWKEVSWSSGDASLKQDTDDEEIARAEAKYDMEMAEIQTKDKIFDLQLQQINTEHNAIQTEFETVQKVIQKNIERSFKIFNA